MSGVASLAEVLSPDAFARDGSTQVHLAVPATPEAVVRPESPEEVGEALRWASANRMGVVPVGTGRHTTRLSAEVPFIALSTERLAGVELYEAGDLTVTAGAGTTLADLLDTLRPNGQWLPFDPPSMPERTLGGLVATGVSGPVRTGYGELRNHVLGATVVTGDGRVLRLGGRVVKNVAGFDLLRPIVGSRGRLAFVTSVCLRAFPVPAVDRVLVLRADDVSDLDAAARAVRTAPVLPVSSVVMAPAPSLQAAAALLVRLHGAEVTVEADRRTIEEHTGVRFEVPSDQSAVSATARDHANAGRIVIEVTVLPSRLFEAIRLARETLDAAVLSGDAYGGSLRIAGDQADPGSVGRLREMIEELGGSLIVSSCPPEFDRGSAESRPSPDELEIAGSLERAFDPSGVFAPCRV